MARLCVKDLLAVCDEQEPVARQCAAQASEVHRGHHGLARPGGRDQEVAMVTPRACERHLLEQAFLEGTKGDLDRAEREVGGPSRRGALRELARVERHEVAACQYVSKTASIFAITSGLRTPETRTFHSRPVTFAECVRFDEPMYAVE